MGNLSSGFLVHCGVINPVQAAPDLLGLGQEDSRLLQHPRGGLPQKAASGPALPEDASIAEAAGVDGALAKLLQGAGGGAVQGDKAQ